tara:strand:- start:1440 stop:2729 length:1290 start_codon:yes stop_codon:yes gene_type:complete
VSIVSKIRNRFFKSSREAETTKEVQRYTGGSNYLGRTLTLDDIESTTVSEKGAMKIVAYYECVKEISEAIAMMPRKWYRIQKGEQVPYNDFDQVVLWKDHMNEYVTTFQTVRTWLVQFFERGNGYLVAKRDGSRIVSYHNNNNLYPFLDKNKVLWYYDYESGKVYYHYDVLHLRDISNDPYVGMSKARYHALTLGRSKAAKVLANKMYSNGTFLGAAIEYPEAIDHKMIDTDTLRNTIKAKYQGIDKAGEIMVITRGGQLKQLKVDMPLADAEYVADSELSTDEIRATFNMPPKKGNSYNSIEQKNIEILRKAILPIVTMIEQEVNYKCVPTKERGKVFMKHKFEGFLRADSKSRMEVYSKGIEKGIYLINEVRKWENLAPIEGGDTPMFAANNMLPLSLAEEYGEAQIKKILGNDNGKEKDNKGKKKS